MREVIRSKRHLDPSNNTGTPRYIVGELHTDKTGTRYLMLRILFYRDMSFVPYTEMSYGVHAIPAHRRDLYNGLCRKHYLQEVHA